MINKFWRSAAPMMRPRFYFLFFIMLFVSLTGRGEPIVLTHKDYLECARITRIDKETGTIKSIVNTNIKIDLAENNCAIGPNGNDIVVNGYNPPGGTLVKNVMGDVGLCLLPAWREAILPQFSEDGKTVLYISDFGHDPNGTVVVHKKFDVFSESLVDGTSIYHDGRFVRQSLISRNGGTVVSELYCNYSSFLFYVYHKNGHRWEINDFGPYDDLVGLWVTDDGNRFYYLQETGDTKKCFYRDKLGNEWSNERILPEFVLHEDREEIKLELDLVINNGKTLVLKSNCGRIAQVQELEDGWSQPEYVGFAEPVFDRDTFLYASDDGRVIAVKAFNREFMESATYDVFAFIKNERNEWIRRRITPIDVPAVREILLSADGETLMWIPLSSTDVPFFEDYK